MNAKSSMSEGRSRHPEQIYKAQAEYPDSKIPDPLGIRLQIARKQQEERYREMKQHQKQADPHPGAIHPADVERNFVGEIAGPDQQELREAKVRPQHDEGEQQGTDILQMLACDDFRKRRTRGEQDDHGDYEGNSRHTLA